MRRVSDRSGHLFPKGSGSQAAWEPRGRLGALLQVGTDPCPERRLGGVPVLGVQTRVSAGVACDLWALCWPVRTYGPWCGAWPPVGWAPSLRARLPEHARTALRLSHVRAQRQQRLEPGSGPSPPAGQGRETGPGAEQAPFEIFLVVCFLSRSFFFSALLRNVYQSRLLRVL